MLLPLSGRSITRVVNDTMRQANLIVSFRRNRGLVGENDTVVLSEETAIAWTKELSASNSAKTRSTPEKLLSLSLWGVRHEFLRILELWELPQ